ASVRRNLWRKASIGVGVSTFSRTLDDVTGVATIPSPIFFNQPRTITTTTSGLKHSEIAVHLSFGWTFALSDRIDVLIYGGPTAVRVKQDAVPTITVNSNSTVTAVVQEQSGTATGGHIGFDARFRFSEHIGVGIFVRAAPATADLDSIPNLKVGGGQ